MFFKLRYLVIDTGKEEWGAEKDKQYFVIKLGDRYMSSVRKKYNLSHAEIFNIDLLITNCSLFKKIKA